jgi:hypothetical protein
MALLYEYRAIAAECARLAQMAPSQRGKASFAIAAYRWMILAQLNVMHAAENAAATATSAHFQ